MKFRRAPPKIVYSSMTLLYKDNSLIANRAIAGMNAPESVQTRFSSWARKLHETAISLIQVNFHRCD